MARCGCTPKCNCILNNGLCTNVTGDGSAAKPYVINIKTDNQTVFCTGAGLQAILNTQDTNTVDLSGDGTVGNPLKADVILTPDAQVPDPDALGTGNLIKLGPTGIYVSCEDIQDCVGSAIDIDTADCLEYDDATNTISIKICGEPNGIECVPAGDPNCPTGGLAVYPSSDPDNSLTFGTDNRLYAPSAAIVPGDCMVFTGAGTATDPFVISPQVAIEPNGLECIPGQGLAVIPSSDAGNQLKFGADQRLYVNACPLVQGGAQVLTGNTGPCFDLTGGDCGIPMVATLRLSDDTCQGLICGNDGLFVQNDLTNLPPDTELTQDFGPFGPFNGFIPFAPNGGIILVGPLCIDITNPSPCRDMVTKGVLTGFAETGRTGGRFRLAFDISAGGIGGPWFSVSQMGQSNPQPASRQTGNAIWSGNEVTIGPGGTRTLCFRIGFNANNPALPVVNGRVFAGSFTLSIQARWAK